MIIKNPWTNENIKVEINKTTYKNNGNLAVVLTCYDEEYDCWEPYGNLTVNLGKKLPPNMAYVDTNNMPMGEEFITENKLGEFADDYGFSGFCIYPLYKFY